MAVRTIECGACGSVVPYGRLSCPSCGELLASVAGAARRLTSLRTLGEPVEPVKPVYPGQADAAASDAAASGEALDVEAAHGELVAAEPPSLEVAPPAPAFAAPAAGDAMEVPSSWPARAPAVPTADPVSSAAPRPIPPDLHDGEALRPSGTATGASMSSGVAPVSPAPAFAMPSLVGAGAIAAATTGVAATGVSVATTGASPMQPGAYVPPTPTPVPFPVDTPAIPAPARAWAGTRDPQGPPAASDTDATSGRATRSLTDAATRDEAVGWIAVAGGTIAVLGFLLPWATVVIGGIGNGYLATWGLAGPGHPVVVLALLGVVALALIGQRLPMHLRLGLPGLLLTGVVIGLLWPYLFGRLGPLPGVYLTAVGAILLLAASIAALVLPRHERSPQGV